MIVGEKSIIIEKKCAGFADLELSLGQKERRPDHHPGGFFPGEGLDPDFTLYIGELR
ncbi:MAG: hypothetical protein ACP5I1_02815 [Candidatus Hinthialibacter sp.]